MHCLLGFPGGSAGKEPACNVGDLGSIPGLGRSLGGGKGYPLQYSGQENSMDCKVHVFTESQTRLSDFHFPVFKLLTYITNIEMVLFVKWYYLSQLATDSKNFLSVKSQDVFDQLPLKSKLGNVVYYCGYI